jgi:hypothetical protein
MAQARARGLDVSRAEALDEASRHAAQRGDWQENRRTLRQAVDLLERALRRGQGPPRR